LFLFLLHYFVVELCEQSGVKNSKILQNSVLTVVKVLSLAGLMFLVLLLRMERFGMQLGQRLVSSQTECETGEWLPYGWFGISGISAALWVRIFEWLGKG
jgi:hypothetical protein